MQISLYFWRGAHWPWVWLQRRSWAQWSPIPQWGGSAPEKKRLCVALLIATLRKRRQRPHAPRLTDWLRRAPIPARSHWFQPPGSLWLPWPWEDHCAPLPGTVLGLCLQPPAVSFDAGGLREDPASSRKNSMLLTVHVISTRHGWTVQGQFEVELLRWVGCKHCSHVPLSGHSL